MVYDYEYFKGAVLQLTGIDLNAYKERQMKRRIDALIAKNGIVGYDGIAFNDTKIRRKRRKMVVGYLRFCVCKHGEYCRLSNVRESY